MKRAPENRKIFGNNGSDAGEIQGSVTGKRPNQNKKPVLTEDGLRVSALPTPSLKNASIFENLQTGACTHFVRTLTSLIREKTDVHAASFFCLDFLPSLKGRNSARLLCCAQKRTIFLTD